MRLLYEKDYPGTQKIKMLRNCVAGQKPRLVGDEVEVPALEAAELIFAGHAARVVEGPRLVVGL